MCQWIRGHPPYPSPPVPIYSHLKWGYIKFLVWSAKSFKRWGGHSGQEEMVYFWVTSCDRRFPGGDTITVGNTIHTPRSPPILAVAQTSGLSSCHNCRMCYSFPCSSHIHSWRPLTSIHSQGVQDPEHSLCLLLGSWREPPSDSESFRLRTWLQMYWAEVPPWSCFVFVFAFGVIRHYISDNIRAL